MEYKILIYICISIITSILYTLKIIKSESKSNLFMPIIIAVIWIYIKNYITNFISWINYNSTINNIIYFIVISILVIELIRLLTKKNISV